MQISEYDATCPVKINAAVILLAIFVSFFFKAGDHWESQEMQFSGMQSLGMQSYVIP